MGDLDNDHVADLIRRILDDPADYITEDFDEELIETLAYARFVCPVDEDGCIICLQLNQSTFIPAACDVEDCKRVFKQEDYDIFAFSHFEEYFDGDMDGVMINPGSTGFIVNRHYSRMVFNRINDEMKPPVTKGYDVKVRLNGFRPLTWRDLIIPENITFDELDDVLKTLWGFNGSHLSAFLIKKDDLIIVNRDLSRQNMMGCDFDSSTTSIDEIFDKYDKVTYWYDFGDDWRFDIEVKRKVDYDKRYVTIKRFKGKYNPIEDCSGVYGLSEIVYLAENPDDGDSYFEDYLDYLEEFDMDYTQRLLKNKGYVTSQWRDFVASM